MKSKRLLPESTLEKIGLDFEVGFYESALESRPDHLGALEALANAYTRRGDVDDGLRVDRRITQILPENPIAHYNLACSLSLAGRIDEALVALERAVSLGYDDFEYLARDPDLANVRKDARYRVLITR